MTFIICCTKSWAILHVCPCDSWDAQVGTHSEGQDMPFSELGRCTLPIEQSVAMHALSEHIRHVLSSAAFFKSSLIYRDDVETT